MSYMGARYSIPRIAAVARANPRSALAVGATAAAVAAYEYFTWNDK